MTGTKLRKKLQIETLHFLYCYNLNYYFFVAVEKMTFLPASLLQSLAEYML